MTSPSYMPRLERRFPRPELTVIAGSLSEPRREIEQTVAPLRHMRGWSTLLALSILAALYVIGLTAWGLS